MELVNCNRMFDKPVLLMVFVLVALLFLQSSMVHAAEEPSIRITNMRDGAVLTHTPFTTEGTFDLRGQEFVSITADAGGVGIPTDNIKVDPSKGIFRVTVPDNFPSPLTVRLNTRDHSGSSSHQAVDSLQFQISGRTESSIRVTNILDGSKVSLPRTAVGQYTVLNGRLYDSITAVVGSKNITSSLEVNEANQTFRVEIPKGVSSPLILTLRTVDRNGQDPDAETYELTFTPQSSTNPALLAVYLLIGLTIFERLGLGRLFRRRRSPSRRRQPSRRPPSIGKGTKRSREKAAANQLETVPYKSGGKLLTPSELQFFRALESALGDYDLHIATKVRLADLVAVRGGTGAWRSHFNRIQSKHIDFVISDRQDMLPLLAIELDDPSHERPDRVRRDEFVDKALEAAGLTLMRFWVSESYDARELHDEIVMRLPSVRPKS